MDVVSGGDSLASSFQALLEVLEMYGAPPSLHTFTGLCCRKPQCAPKRLPTVQ